MCWQHAGCFGITERTLPKTYVCFVCENPPGETFFLAPLAEGQRAIVMALCPLCVRPCVRP